MKLLGWMHRKFRQNSGETLKDFVIGQAPSDEQHYFPRTSINKPFKQAQTNLNLTKSLSGSCLDDVESYVEDNSEIFPGFLAIGTLGSSDPATPKFSISIEYITERQTDQVTQNDLKLINDELEKVLDAKHDTALELGLENNNNGGDVCCPLQGYLFGSAVELSETSAVGKKESRMSLGELFQKSKVLEEVGGGKCEKEGIQLMKKKMKKRRITGDANSKSSNTLSSTASAAAGVLDVSTTSDQTKLHKILHLFNRSKVYPESSTMMKEKLDQKAKKKNKKKKTNIDHGGNNKNNNGDKTSTNEAIKNNPKKLIFNKTSIPHNYKIKSINQHEIDDADSILNKLEQWIKIDEEL